MVHPSMKNFLYISFFFPPLGGPEPRHNLSVIRRLYAKGFSPTIVTAPQEISYSKDQFLESLIPEEIKIRRITWPYEPNKYISKIRELTKIPANPFVFKGWRHIYKAARKEVVSANYQFLYSVHGIGAAHLAALRLKRETGLPWVVEFRDPWSHNFILWKYLRDKSWAWWYEYNFRKTKKFLGKVLENADLVIVESPMHGDLLVRDFGISEDNVVSYGIGYDEDYFSETESCLINFTQKPVIGFVGSVYHGYDDAVRNFVLALRELEKRGYNFSLVSVGDNSSLFSKCAQEADLKSFLPIDRVKLSTALTLMQRMDFGLVCTFSEHKSHINSKLWEYLKSNLSILAIVPEDGSMAKIVNEGKCGYVLPYNAEGMIPILERAFNEYGEEKALRASPEFVAQFSRERMVDKLVEKLEWICSKKER